MVPVDFKMFIPTGNNHLYNVCKVSVFHTNPVKELVFTFAKLYKNALLPDREGRYAGQFQGLLRTGCQGLPSRHTIEISSPGTQHTSVKKLK